MRNKQASSRLTADEDNETLDHLLSLSCETGNAKRRLWPDLVNGPRRVCVSA